MDIKTLRKYLQSRQNYFFQLKYVAQISKKSKLLTDYERGYNAGICHMVKLVNKTIHDDIMENNFKVVALNTVEDNYHLLGR